MAAGSEKNPAGDRHARSYPVPYREVWDAVVAGVERSPRWELVEADPRRREVRATTWGLILRARRPVRVVLGLDEAGATVVAVHRDDGEGGGAPLRTRPVARFLRRLDRALREAGAGGPAA